MKSIIVGLLFVSSFSWAAEDGAVIDMQDFDSLGGNQVILERARALEPDKEIGIVQNRLVPRRQRWELGSELSSTFGGDTYTRTKSLGLNLHYHFTPRWSVGIKYNHAFNDLTPEGRTMAKAAYEDFKKNPINPSVKYASLDYPLSETLGLLSWYPFYGKVSLLDKAVAHFDVYFLAGAGTIHLLSGPTPTYTGGAGIGFWVNKHFSTRMEMRYQNYTAKYFSVEQGMEMAVGSIQMGWLL